MFMWLPLDMRSHMYSFGLRPIEVFFAFRVKKLEGTNNNGAIDLRFRGPIVLEFSRKLPSSGSLEKPALN